jgi:hypothetical protein
VGKSELPIGHGRFVIGRAPNSDIRLDSTLVSRAHAALTYTEAGNRITLEDLKSRNGVFVNGVLVQRPVPLEVGDQIRIGDQELELVRVTAPASANPETMNDAPDEPFEREEVHEELTTRSNALDLLSSIVDRALAAGDAAEAESLIAGHLSVLLGEARTSGSLKAPTALSAARFALKLAASTGKGTWVDYVVELHLTAKLLTPLVVVHELFDISSKARMTDKSLLRRYIDFVRNNHARLGPEAMIVLQRLERFQRL